METKMTKSVKMETKERNKARNERTKTSKWLKNKNKNEYMDGVMNLSQPKKDNKIAKKLRKNIALGKIGRSISL